MRARGFGLRNHSEGTIGNVYGKQCPDLHRASVPALQKLLAESYPGTTGKLYDPGSDNPVVQLGDGSVAEHLGYDMYVGSRGGSSRAAAAVDARLRHLMSGLQGFVKKHSRSLGGLQACVSKRGKHQSEDRVPHLLAGRGQAPTVTTSKVPVTSGKWNLSPSCLRVTGAVRSMAPRSDQLRLRLLPDACSSRGPVTRSRYLVLAAMVAAGLTILTPSALARAGSGPAIPVAGDWEGTGPDGIPLSFELTRWRGRLIATAVTLGAQGSCPANGRDATATPLEDVAYAGPGGLHRVGFFTSRATASLTGRFSYAPKFTARISGRFTSPRTGTFETSPYPHSSCGWPTKRIVWKVHSARRRAVPDKRWTAQVSGPGITSGSLDVLVYGKGRVIKSVAGSFACQYTDSSGFFHQDTENFSATPTYEFIHPDGAFYSPVDSNLVNGDPTTWQGTFATNGALSGILNIYDPCTFGVAQMTFGASGPT